MKILITSDLYTAKTNGVVTSIRNLTAELTTMGNEVRILSFSDTKESYRTFNAYFLASASLERIYPNLRMPVTFHHDYLKELIEWKPDVIHSQCEFFSYSFAKYIADKTGAPIVHTYNSLYEQYLPYLISNQRLGNYLIRAFTRRRLKSAELVIAPTRKVEKALREYGVSNPISVIPCGIRLEQHSYRLSARERCEMRSSLGIEDDQMVLLNLGRLGVEKNIDEILILLSMELLEQEKLMLVIVGDGPARQDLEQAVKELEIEDHVIFTGMVPPDQVQNYYQIADVFVCASTSETQGLTYIEAAANALPLLCRRDPCLENVLEDGKNGFIYETIEEFSTGLKLLQESPDLRKSAGIRSEEIASRFNCAAFGVQVSEVYHAVVADSIVQSGSSL